MQEKRSINRLVPSYIQYFLFLRLSDATPSRLSFLSLTSFLCCFPSVSLTAPPALLCPLLTLPVFAGFFVPAIIPSPFISSRISCDQSVSQSINQLDTCTIWLIYIHYVVRCRVGIG